MTIYAENLKQVMIPLMTRLQSEYAGLAGARLKDGTRDGSALDRLNEGIWALHHIATSVHAWSRCDPEPTGSTSNSFNESWLNLALRELQEFNRNGAEYINSCSEALIKSHGVINWLYAGANRKRIFYRGEHKYSWDLKPRVGRGLCKHDPSDPLRITDCELGLLAEFQARVQSDVETRKSIFGQRQVPPEDDPEWWALMAHYDSKHGTRMIDLTSSLFCGLFFACADWNGSIDESIDGALYLLHSEPWRPESKDPHIIRGRIVGFKDPWMTSARQYFNLPKHPDTLRFREARDRNERLIAQDGFFVWQPKFDEPLLGDVQRFKFRIYREAKKHILRELYSIGYTALRIVRGSYGEMAHKRLCGELGLQLD